jgi:hypothetical protein
MAYIQPFAQMLWFTLQNILIFHLKILGAYFSAWAAIVQGDRVTEILYESLSYMAVQRDRLAEAYDGEPENQSVSDDGPEQSAA